MDKKIMKLKLLKPNFNIRCNDVDINKIISNKDSYG